MLFVSGIGVEPHAFDLPAQHRDHYTNRSYYLFFGQETTECRKKKRAEQEQKWKGTRFIVNVEKNLTPSFAEA